MHKRSYLLLFLITAIFVPGISSFAAPPSQASGTTVYLPFAGAAEARFRAGYDLRIVYGAQAETLLSQIPAGWARAGDLLWNDIEPTRGVYNWAAAAPLEANIRRIRAANLEPIVMVQIAPTWARVLPDRFCSPVAQEAYADLARFAAALTKRYSSGDLTVRYWQFWNEPDFKSDIDDGLGSGCWNTGVAPWYGGDAYGAALRAFAASMRATNASARIICGNFAHPWPDDQQTLAFLRGIIENGGLDCDIIGFSGYTRWGSAERMTLKAQSLRRVLTDYGLSSMPLVATEVGDVCQPGQPCGAEFYQTQANYAARIQAEAMAIDLYGILWHTLIFAGTGFQQSHLVEATTPAVTLRPAFYAYRNAARQLRGAYYAGPPLSNIRYDEDGKVQLLRFTDSAGAPVYVAWLPNATEERSFALLAWPYAHATCISHLELPTPLATNCSDTRGDGEIRFKVSDAPVYVRFGS